MGLTHISATVKNPKNPKLFKQGKFLVDTGAQYTVLPGDVVSLLNLKANRDQEFVLADGTVIKRQIGEALFEYNGQLVTTTVVLGEKTDEYLMGAVTLEEMGLAINPFTRQIYPVKLMKI